MPIANGWIDAKVIDSRIYIKNYIPSTSSGLYDVYDPASDTWNSSVSSPQDGKLLLDYISNGYETTGAMSTKMIYTFNSDFSSNVKAYNPENDSWQNGVASSLERNGFGIALAKDIFYVVGGYSYSFLGNFAPFATNEKYTPFGYGTPDPSYLLEITPPKIAVLSPLNQTYNVSSVPLVFDSDKTTNWTGYSLDGQQNVTFSGNTNLTDISNGLHDITVYAQDTFGTIGSSNISSFIVAKPEPESFPVVPVVAVSGVAVAVVVGLIFYYRKRTH